MKRIFLEKDNMIGEKNNILYKGIILNEKVTLSNDIDTCDYIFICFRDATLARRYDSKYYKKMVIIDYIDSANNIIDIPCLKYFKRSVVDVQNSALKEYDRDIIPISYCLKNETLHFKNVFENNRSYHISIFFDPKESPTSKRCNVAHYIKHNMQAYNNHVGKVGSAGKIGRNSIQKEYYEKMFQSQIVVTCNPDNWEGDYRTWEALSSGALVFVDKMITPIVHPLVHQKHVIFYNKNNLADLRMKLQYYLENSEVRETIAREGHAFALQYHKTSDRIDEILNHLVPTT